MSRVFWMVVGAAGGVMAYRKGTEAVARARELGPLGTAQVAAQMTSRVAGRTAHGLGRLNDLKAQREGRLVRGSAEEVRALDARSVGIDEDWIPVPEHRPGPPRPAAAQGPVEVAATVLPGPGGPNGPDSGRIPAAGTTAAACTGSSATPGTGTSTRARTTRARRG